MVRCKNLKVRQKHHNKFLWCNDKKNIITFDECRNCLKSNLVRNKPIKRVSNKRVFINKDTYQKVYERDKGICRICGRTNIELHHILYRSERKDLINDVNNCIMLCTECHRLVHSNKHYWQKKLIEMIGEKYE